MRGALQLPLAAPFVWRLARPAVFPATRQQWAGREALN